MVDIYIDPITNDIDLTNNTIRLTKSVEELTRQQVSITLNAFRGEWRFNIDFGVPYLANDNNQTQLLGAGDNTNLLDLAIKDAILSNEGCLLYTSPSPRDRTRSRMPSSA